MITRINDYNLRNANTFRVNAHCDEWIEYTSAADLPEIRAIIGTRPYMSLGEGSNMLFTTDFHGVILQSRILDIEVESGQSGTILARVGSGVKVDDFIIQCAAQQIWGLENLSGIPGMVGASAVQNVGAYGVEAGDRIDKVEAFDMHTDEEVIFSTEECKFGYRDSIFKHQPNRYVITYVTYRLSATPNPVLDYGNLRHAIDGIDSLTPLAVRKAVLVMRGAKLPDVDKVGSAGSFFKNPVVSEDTYKMVCSRAETSDVPYYKVGNQYKIPAAWLIEQSGMKGKKVRGAQVWERQPLVIVNSNSKATAEDIVELEQLIKDTVSQKFGINLIAEVDHIGSYGRE